MTKFMNPSMLICLVLGYSIYLTNAETISVKNAARGQSSTLRTIAGPPLAHKTESARTSISPRSTPTRAPFLRRKQDSSVQQGGYVTVEAGVSPVHVGTLTSTALFTSISSALDKLCPSVTQTTSNTACSTDTVVIGNIPYVSGGSLQEGELLVSVESGSYNNTDLRTAMINTAATTAQQAAIGSNCYNATYEVLWGKRDLHHPWSPMRFFSRATQPVLRPETKTFCNTVGFAGIHYYDPYWNEQPTPGSSDWIDARWSFKVAPGGDFVCQLLSSVLNIFDMLSPEFALAVGAPLGAGINVLCQEQII